MKMSVCISSAEYMNKYLCLVNFPKALTVNSFIIQIYT